MIRFILVASSFFAVSSRAQADRAVVRVNGTPILQSEVMDKLWRLYGQQTLDDMINLLLLRQEALADKIEVGGKEIDRRVELLRSRFSDSRLMASEFSPENGALEKLKDSLRDEITTEALLEKEAGISVSKAEIKAAFDPHRKELGQPAMVHLLHLLVRTKEDAKNVIESLRAGGDFGDIAALKSLNANDRTLRGDYGFVAQGMLPGPIGRAVFDLRPGDTTMVPTEDGWHVVKALARKDAAPASYDADKEALRILLLQEKVRQALPAFIQKLRQKAEIVPG